MNQKTYTPKAKEVSRDWHLIDLEGKVLGRAASEIATLLQGKNKPYFSYHLDCGDFVVGINASKVMLSGRKEEQKQYFSHSGYPGGVKETPLKKLRKDNPNKVIELAVKGMLPKNKLRTPRLRRLKVFADNKHIYEDKFKSVEKK